MADIVTNHKARRDYHVLETFEAGIVLHGTEVKSLRAGKGQIADAFARVEKDEVWLYNAHIDEYSKGNALFPLSFYWKNGKVKVSLGVGKGKQEFDKRDDIKQRDSDRELQRAKMKWTKGR